MILRILNPDVNVAKVSGWGVTQSDEDDQLNIVRFHQLQKLEVPLINVQDCAQLFLSSAGVDISSDLRYWRGCQPIFIETLLCLEK